VDENDILKPDRGGGEPPPGAGPGGDGGGPGPGGPASPFDGPPDAGAAFSEDHWYEAGVLCYAETTAAHKVGDVWKGPSGRWFTRRQDGRIVPARNPNAEAKKAAPAKKATAPEGEPKPTLDGLHAEVEAARKDGLTPEKIGALGKRLAEHLTCKQIEDLKKRLGAGFAGKGGVGTGPKQALADRIAARAAELAAKGAAPPKQAQPWEDGGKPDPGQVYNAPTDALQVDPARFQFKLGATHAGGVTEELLAVKNWNPDFAGVVSVWQDPADGKTYVVNGHHRRELAGRLGVKDLAVRYVTAGSAKEARAIGALVNIAEGRGTAVDAAKFMRDSGAGVEDLEKRGVSLKGKLAQDATALTALSDRLFDRLARGDLDQGQALAVAKHLKDHEGQDQLFRLLDKRRDEGKDLSDRVVEEMARMMAVAPKGKAADQGGFFAGFGQEEETLFIPRAEVTAHVRGELSKEVNDFLMAASKRRAGRLGQAGNVLDVEANRKIADQAAQVRGTFDTLVNRKGPIADAVNEATVAYHKATTKKGKDDARRQALAAVRDAVFREAGVEVDATGAGRGGGGGAPAGRG
jgi:hypothetical protein